jgi:hypothetical protein
MRFERRSLRALELECLQALVHPVAARFTDDAPGHMVRTAVRHRMSACPSCMQPTSDPGAVFCPYCGFALPTGRQAPESAHAFAELPMSESEASPSVAELPASENEANSVEPWQRPAWASQSNPRAVAVGLGALATAVLLAIVLSYGSGSSGPDRRAQLAAAAPHRHTAAATQASAAGGRPVGLPRVSGTPPRPAVRLTPYRASGYSFAYPPGWQVSRGDQPITTYRQTVLQSADGAATVNVDYSPGETTDPASKATQVEEATRSTTAGYRRLAFRATAVNGHAAFAWDFVVADTDPRRADLFVRVPGGEFALLAHGLDLARASAAARSIAGSLSAR